MKLVMKKDRIVIRPESVPEDVYLEGLVGCPPTARLSWMIGERSVVIHQLSPSMEEVREAAKKMSSRAVVDVPEIWKQEIRETMDVVSRMLDEDPLIALSRIFDMAESVTNLLPEFLEEMSTVRGNLSRCVDIVRDIDVRIDEGLDEMGGEKE